MHPSGIGSSSGVFEGTRRQDLPASCLRTVFRCHRYSVVRVHQQGAVWLVVGDHRAEVAAKVALIIERHGVGVGMMVLHAQQMNARHIPFEIPLQPTRRLEGSRGESVLYVPIRKYRNDVEKLAELNIVKPTSLWDDTRVVSHEYDKKPCFYCSCSEINPSEVVVTLEGVRLGLSRNYSLGFTFAPFGDPVSVMHFLAWDSSDNPLNMNRTPVTVSDLVQLTQQINVSILTFFAGTGIEDHPVVDGVSNGWAGNSIYHQHGASKSRPIAGA